MFICENSYRIARRKSVAKARKSINLEGQKHWPVNRSGARRVWLPERTFFAQNEAYLELCNPGWFRQWLGGMGIFYGLLPCLVMIWMWYGFALHPLLFGEFIFLLPTATSPYVSEAWPLLWGSWLLFFPLAVGAGILFFALIYHAGLYTHYFTYARGRIRFNRQTRKVYVLRPRSCGGHQVFEWDRLVALFDSFPKPNEHLRPLALYHPPFDPDDPEAKGEDCIFVGNANDPQEAAHLWEYIRQYMEVGPSVDRVPKDASDTYKGIARYPHPDYFTYCGKPSWMHYGMETGGGFFQTFEHMLTQVTCTWARFPREWQSDSGLGEPEDRPVQTGAVMTAMVYRAKGKLSKEDEIKFLTHWGTKEALAEARARA